MTFQLPQLKHFASFRHGRSGHHLHAHARRDVFDLQLLGATAAPGFSAVLGMTGGLLVNSEQKEYLCKCVLLDCKFRLGSGVS